MAMRRLVDISFCIFHQIGCCFRPKKHSLGEFRRQYFWTKLAEGDLEESTKFLGYRLADGLPVAVKFVRHRQVAEWTLVGKELIPSEICFLERCQDCEGVIPLVDWFSSRKGFLLVMSRPQRFLDLFDLLNILGRLDEKIARGIFAQIVKTTTEMRRLHSVVHRDIKDENIVLDLDTGQAWLCDFGAAEFEERARFRHFQGTKSYCPPEVFEKKGVCNYLPLEAAVWSLGILLYTMLVGHPPFQNEAQICTGQLRIPEHISDECQSLLRQCLCPLPECRILFDQLQAHPWLANKNNSLGHPLGGMEIRKLLKRHERGSFGTGRTESESTEEEECSYRASSTNPRPISIPLNARQYSTEEWASASADEFNLNEKCRPDSGIETASEAILRQSFYDNLTNSPQDEEMATASFARHSAADLANSSAYSSSYYSLGESLIDLVQPKFLGQGSSAESIGSSIYFSTCSISRGSVLRTEWEEIEEDEEEDLTMMAEPINKGDHRIGRKFGQENGGRSSESEEEETIRTNIEHSGMTK